MSRGELIDATARRRALGLQGSFIVQAPAGSGKTELLARRFLALLAAAGAPEEILAITFTVKAAAEMRERVLNGLRAVASGKTDELDAETAELAERALARARDADWDLIRHPARLRIMTIDALCHAIARQMPLLARTVAALRVETSPRPLYRAAARRTLAELDGELGEPLARLLSHLDNRLSAAEALLASLLERRDHWLPFLLPRRAAPDRHALEASLERLIEDDLLRLRSLLPEHLVAQWLPLAAAAAANLALDGRQSALLACQALEAWPGATGAALPAWRGLVELVLTGGGTWRKRADINIGLPPRARELKPRHAELIDALKTIEGLERALHGVRQLPEPQYTHAQWIVLEALLQILPNAAAELELLFGEAGAVDYVGVASAARVALGEPDAPTDQALSLDYRIRHLLVDEFQDTSVGQYRLLEALTAGWQPDDGRTLFLVGDPMQSIYRFREAEVGLFLSAARRGLGTTPLAPLRLEVNFRSQSGLVDWYNEIFAPLFPRDDAPRGAVSYAVSQPHVAPLDGSAVGIHRLDDPAEESAEVCRLICEAVAADRRGRVAVLVASRRHLYGLFDRLRAAGQRFQAVEIESLAERPVIQDLLALTRALVHRADRTAWLALLRAPWCGLALADLFGLAGDDGGRRTVWQLLQDDERCSRLSPDARARLGRVVPVLAASLREQGRRSLRDWVQSTWIGLGGPAAVAGEADLADAGSFFMLLGELARGTGLNDAAILEERLEQLYAAGDSGAGEQVQLMTIHRAKGLEFDTVILPGLGRRTGQDEPELLRWLEIVRPGQANDLVLAPLAPYGEDTDPLQGYLQRRERERDEYERLRLLYVAATRARRRLHLVAAIDAETGEPPAESLLGLLWPSVRAAFDATPRPSGPMALPLEPSWALRRLAADWQQPPPPPSVSGALGATLLEAEQDALPRFEWASELARHVGTVVHEELLALGRAALPDDAAAWLASREARQRRRLRGLGVPPAHADAALARVAAALGATLEDVRGRWLLDAAHREARAEWALSGWLDGRLRQVVIDRSFIDAEARRWIVDYKTSRHEGADREAFLDNEQRRYRAQLELYARLVAGIDAHHPIRLALYFPLLGGWREWSAPAH